MSSVDPASELPPNSPHEERGSRLMFIAGAIVVAGALSIAAAQLQSNHRPLLLYPLGYGLLTGFLLVELADRMKYAIGKLDLVVVASVTFLGLVDITWQTFRLEPVSSAKEMHPIASAVEDQIRKSAGELPDGQKLLFDHSSDTPLTRFQKYLGKRIPEEKLGKWLSPWPEALWVSELFLGTIGSLWVTRRLTLQDRPK